MTSSRRSSSSLFAAALSLCGCAAAPQFPAQTPTVELTAVPFFPQTEYQCGPAALATVLADAGATVEPDDLISEVYVEGLRGSLQPELLGATRRHGFIPYVIEPKPEALAAELAARRPVLVLQNLGVERIPVWHYAVVVGLAGDDVVLRSGTEERRIERESRFLRSWERGSSWGFVALPPGELPARATPDSYVRALASAEPMIGAAAAEQSYRAALQRWPDDELVLFAAASQRHAVGDLEAASTLYRRVLSAAPQHTAARNNLANALAERGCTAEALSEARAALEAAPPDDPLAAAVRDTVTEIEAAAAANRRPLTTCP